MSKTTIFEFSDYRVYLLDRLGEPGTRTGMRRRACEMLRCHTTYLSQVLRGKSHLSLEHAESLNRFFHHTDQESEFFLALVCAGRAGTKRLEERFTTRLQALRAERNVIKNRLAQTVEIKLEDRERFYSHWVYTAIHALSSIPRLQEPEALAQALGMPTKPVREAIMFLHAIGLIIDDGARITTGTQVLHLDSASPFIEKHHTNWRLHAVSSLFCRRSNDLHYSSAVSLSARDAQRLRENILRMLQENIAIVKNSVEEEAFVFNFDFYRLG